MHSLSDCRDAVFVINCKFVLVTVSIFTHSSMYAIAWVCYSSFVCRSVCLSVTLVNCIKTVERIIGILSLSDRPIILVFRHQGLLCNYVQSYY